MNKIMNLEIKNINDEISKNTTIHEKIAICLSKKIGSMTFVYILITCMVLWSSINITLLLSGRVPFDAPYDFKIMLLLSNSIQLLTPIFILVSQNIQDRRTQALADQEFLVIQQNKEATKETFRYLKNISEQFEALIVKINSQQQKIINFEEEQKSFNDNISSILTNMLSNILCQMNSKPCLLEQIGDDTQLCDKIISELQKYKLKTK